MTMIHPFNFLEPGRGRTGRGGRGNGQERTGWGGRGDGQGRTGRGKLTGSECNRYTLVLNNEASVLGSSFQTLAWKIGNFQDF
jgi:hypothetical protein